MDGSLVTLRRVDEADLSYVERLLRDNDLPWRDVGSKPSCFSIGYDDDERIGVGGLEAYGSDALLRSVVVEESVRGDGFGTALCEALENRARDEGVDALYLLTTTAAEFFAARGYEESERSEAPDPIRRTAEFVDLCPTAATCMRTRL